MVKAVKPFFDFRIFPQVYSIEYFSKECTSTCVTTEMSRYREPLFTILVDIGLTFLHVGEIKHVDYNFSSTIY